MKISDIEEHGLKGVIDKIIKLWPIVLPTRMYHVTKKENLDSILKHGLQTKKYGEVHGSMSIAPPKPSVYISIHPESNNLHTELSGFDLVSLQIDASYIDLKNVYIDDGFYAAFGNEQVFYDEDEVSDDLNIDLDEAEKLLRYLETLSDDKIVSKTRFLIGWYIQEHGELAVTQNIPPNAIIDFKDIHNPFD